MTFPANTAANPTTPRLFLLRHGEFPSNPLGLLDTFLPGARLNDTGVAQAMAAAQRLADMGCSAPVVYHSEAARASHTAELIAHGLNTALDASTCSPEQRAATTGVSTQVLPGMFEVQAGVLEMRGDIEALTEYRHLTHGWMDGLGLHLLVDGGETGHAVRDRAFAQLEKVRAEQLVHGRDAVVVAHGTLNRVVTAMLGAVSGAWARANSLPNAGIVPLVAEGEGSLAGAASWRALAWADAPDFRPH